MLQGQALSASLRGPLVQELGISVRPHRLEAQDTGFSSLVRGFKSPWGRRAVIRAGVCWEATPPASALAPESHGCDRALLPFLVGEGGFEPPTSSTQSLCTTRLCYSPMLRAQWLETSARRRLSTIAGTT